MQESPAKSRLIGSTQIQKLLLRASLIVYAFLLTTAPQENDLARFYNDMEDYSANHIDKSSGGYLTEFDNNYIRGRHMSGSIRKIIRGSLAAILLALSAYTYADTVERVVSFDVSNTSAHMAALDQFLTSDVNRGRKATLWAPMFRGSSPANRTLVISHDSFEDLVTSGRRVAESKEWMTLQQAADGSAEVVGNSMAKQVVVEGTGWNNHGALVVVTLSVSDPATYIAGFREMIENVDNPGSIRLMELRYGGGATNYVALFSAPDAVAANKYVDDLQGNAAFQEFAAKIAGIRKVNNISIMRRVKTWGT